MKKKDPTDGGGERESQDFAVELWNRTEARSIINLVPGLLANVMLEAGRARPDLFQMDERTLYKYMRGDENSPSPTDNRLRLKFWDEYDRAQAANDKMNLVAVYTGVCTRRYFEQRYCHNTSKIAWLLCMPASYETKMEEALAFGIEQLRDILELPNVSATTGRADTKLMELKAKIVAMMDIRVKGGIVQKVEQKNMNLNIATSDKTVAHHALNNSMEAIDRRLKELDRRDRLALAKDIVVEAE